MHSASIVAQRADHVEAFWVANCWRGRGSQCDILDLPKLVSGLQHWPPGSRWDTFPAVVIPNILECRGSVHLLLGPGERGTDESTLRCAIFRPVERRSGTLCHRRRCCKNIGRSTCSAASTILCVTKPPRSEMPGNRAKRVEQSEVLSLVPKPSFVEGS